MKGQSLPPHPLSPLPSRKILRKAFEEFLKDEAALKDFSSSCDSRPKSWRVGSWLRKQVSK